MRIGVSLPSKGGSGTGVNAVISFLTDEYWLATRVDGRQSERIVTRWAWDDSHTTLRLTLRRDVFFHDNTRLTPEIAAESLRDSVRAQDALSFEDIKSVTAAGSDSIDVHLSRPDSFVLPDLATVDVREGDKSAGTAGPFSLVSRNGTEIVLRRFARYYRGRPDLDEIDVRTYPTQRSAWAALMRGDVDMLHEVSRDAAEFVEAESTVNSFKFARPYYIALVFNVRHPVLKNPRVRQALNEALDREVLVRDGLNGWGRPADGPIPPEHWAYSAGTPFVFNPDAARATLDAAGYPLAPPAPGTLPRRFAFSCLVYTGDARFEHLALLAQKQLSDLGIEMNLVPVSDARELESRLERGNFDAFLFEMYGRSLSWTYQFWHSQQAGAHLNTGYGAADKALDQLKSALDDDETRASVAELMRVFHEDPPAVFLAWQTSVRAVSTKFDVQPEENRDIFSNVWQWRLAPANRGVPAK